VVVGPATRTGPCLKVSEKVPKVQLKVPAQVESPPDRKGKLSTAAWIFNRAEFEVIDGLVGPFTVDICASPNNAQVPRYFTRASSCLGQDLSGETVWCNPPWVGIADIVSHYKKCKKRSPTSTSSVFVVPAWNAPWVKEFQGWTLLRSYPKGVHLFSIADRDGLRSVVGPTPWPVNVYWDPKEGETRKVQASLGCNPLPDGRVTRTLRSLGQAQKIGAVVEGDLERVAPRPTLMSEIGVDVSAAASSLLLGVAPTVLKGKVGSFSASVMLDSGARPDLVDLSFAQKAGLPVRAEDNLNVRAFDGRPSGTYGIAHGVTLVIGTWRCTLSLLVVDLMQFDIYLGTGWHERYKPRVEWDPRSVSVPLQDGSWKTLPLLEDPARQIAASIPIISSVEFGQLAKEPGSLILICEINPTEQAAPSWKEQMEEVTEPFVRSIILSYKEEFDPVGKPVFSKAKMRLRLVEGAEAPKMRTAKANPKELQEIKTQLEDHLQKGLDQALFF